MVPAVGFPGDGVIVGGLTISKLTFVEWHLVEKNRFTDDLLGRMLDDPPFFCIFASEDEDAPADIAEYRSRKREYQVTILTRSLRLLKRGTVPDPTDYVVYARRGSLNLRRPNRLGRNSYNLPTTNVISADEVRLLNGIFYALTVFDRSRRSLPVAFATHLFSRSYDPTILESTDRFLFLLGSLEALVGRSADALQEVPWREPAITGFLAEYKIRRNAVAHGKEQASAGHALALEEIVRVLIREAISHELEFPRAADTLGKPLIERLFDSARLGPERLATVASEYQRPASAQLQRRTR